MSGSIVFRNFVVGILMIVMFPCTLFSQSNAGSQNPFLGKKYQEGLFLGEYTFDFTATDENGIDLVGIKIDQWFQVDSLVYFYYLWDNEKISILDTDGSVLLDMPYSLSAEGKELKIFNADGSFIELKEKGSMMKNFAKDSATGVISAAFMILGGKTIYNHNKNK